MKVITVDDVVRIISENAVPISIVEEFRIACKEIHEIPVTDLRPMSEAPRCEELGDDSIEILAYHRAQKRFIIVIILNDGTVFNAYEEFIIDEFDGWQSMFQYRPVES